jgi:hypothetical protein
MEVENPNYRGPSNKPYIVAKVEPKERELKVSRHLTARMVGLFKKGSVKVSARTLKC